MNRIRLGMFATAAMALTGAGAFAQPAPPPTPDAQPQPVAGSNQVTEIVVTANKRSERLQDVPQAVTVVSGDQLIRQNVATVDDLSRTAPSLNATSGPAGSIAIRGIGTDSFSTSSESSVGIVVDNVALANATSPISPAALFDVARLEVLEGPQGTLFGRNSSAGVLNVTTNPPKFDTYEAIGHLDVGSRDSQLLQAVINVPIGSDAALRIAGHLTRSPQTIYSAIDHEWNQDDDEGARARLLWKPTESLSINLIADYDSAHNRNDTWAVSNATPGGVLATGLAACGVTASLNNNRTCIEGGVHSTIETYGVSGQIDYLMNGFTLTSITSGRWLTSDPSNLDSDSVATNLLSINASAEHLNNVSQELRLTSPSGGKLEYVLGLYYFHSSVAANGGQDGSLGNPLFEALGLTLGQKYDTKATEASYAGFGQATYHLTDKARFIFGGRIDHEDVQAETTHFLYPGAVAAFTTLLPVGGHITDTDFSYRVGGQYDLTRTVMAYVTYNRGYKGPAVNDQSSSAAVPVLVKPEIPHDVEAGLKTSVFDRRLAVNVALFRNVIDNFQTTVFDPATAGYYFGTAPSLTTQGAELSIFGRPLRDLSINGGVTYTDATYGAGYFTPCGPVQTVQGCVSTDVKGRQLIGSPKWKLTLSGEYAHPLNDRFEGYLQLDGVYTSSISYSAAPDPLDATGSHFLLGGRLGLRTQDGKYGIAIYARNLTDDRAPTFVIAAPLGIPVPGAPGLNDPNAHAQYFGPDSFRTFGVSLDARF